MHASSLCQLTPCTISCAYQFFCESILLNQIFINCNFITNLQKYKLFHYLLLLKAAQAIHENILYIELQLHELTWFLFHFSINSRYPRHTHVYCRKDV